MRRRLRKRLPAAHEVVYEYDDFVVTSFSPTERGYQGVLAIRARAESVKLCFNQGKSLSDPAGLLRGTGQTRWIPLESVSDLSRPAVVALIDQAVTASRPPFPRAGLGSMIIRVTAATKRGRRPD